LIDKSKIKELDLFEEKPKLEKKSSSYEPDELPTALSRDFEVH